MTYPVPLLQFLDDTSDICVFYSTLPISVLTTKTISLLMMILLPHPNLKHYTYFLFCFHTNNSSNPLGPPAIGPTTFPLLKVSLIHFHLFTCSLTRFLLLSHLYFIPRILFFFQPPAFLFFLFKGDDRVSYFLEKIRIVRSKCPYSFTKSTNLNASQCLYSTFLPL